MHKSSMGLGEKETLAKETSEKEKRKRRHQKRGYNSIICKKVTTAKPYKHKRLRTITQMKEKGKTPEKKLSHEEILHLHEKYHILLMLKIMQEIRNKLGAKWITYSKH